MTHEFKTHRLIPSGNTTIEVPIYVEYETFNDQIEIVAVCGSDFRIKSRWRVRQVPAHASREGGCN